LYRVGNGLDALVLIFKDISNRKIAKGDVVIICKYLYSKYFSHLEAGLLPVLIEPKLDTYNLNPDLIQESITSKLKRF
jgi:dTDP-4-amino-4,6-dideoxygalactose transaminase